MRKIRKGLLLLGLLSCLLGSLPDRAEPVLEYSHTPDVIYGRKDGMALTMDVFTPKKNACGRGILCVMSTGWTSRADMIPQQSFHEFLRRGYTVFAVVHGSLPKFSILDSIGDVARAVRFVRYHAREYHIDPDHLGIHGSSSGGHLALMQAMAGMAGHPEAADPVERVSGRVQAVACFFPPTDFLNYGVSGRQLLRENLPAFLLPAAEFQLLNQRGIYVRVTAPKKLHEIAQFISPLTHVSPDDPPTLLIHGDNDPLVPLQQSELLQTKLQALGVPVKLIVKKGAGHGWFLISRDLTHVADWFDKYLER